MKREIILLCILFSTVYTSIYAQYPKKDGFKPQNFVEKIDSNDIIAERLCRIDTAFQRAVDQGILPQAVTLVIHKGNIIHYKAYGWRNIEKKIKCEKDDIFRIASQTKAISVCALMTLWEQGLFRLDDPIKKYIPAFENMQVLDSFDVTTRKYTTRPAKRDITIRDLIKASLRMRPDRIIVGEVRGSEAIDMLQALNTGHDGSLSTGHANSCNDMFTRLETMVLMGMDLPLMAIRRQIASGIDIVVHLGRLRDRSRKVLEITEVLGFENGEIQSRILYQFEESAESTKTEVIGELKKCGELCQIQKLQFAGII